MMNVAWDSAGATAASALPALDPTEAMVALGMDAVSSWWMQIKSAAP